MNLIKHSLTLITLLAISACKTSPSSPSNDMLIGDWQVETLTSEKVKTKPKPKLSFDHKNKLAGTGGCNRLSTSYELNNGQLDIKPIITTRKMCRPTLMQQEQQLLALLNSPLRIQITDEALSIFNQNGELLITAIKTKSITTK